MLFADHEMQTGAQPTVRQRQNMAVALLAGTVTCSQTIPRLVSRGGQAGAG